MLCIISLTTKLFQLVWIHFSPSSFPLSSLLPLSPLLSSPFLSPFLSPLLSSLLSSPLLLFPPPLPPLNRSKFVQRAPALWLAGSLIGLACDWLEVVLADGPWSQFSFVACGWSVGRRSGAARADRTGLLWAARCVSRSVDGTDEYTRRLSSSGCPGPGPERVPVRTVIQNHYSSRVWRQPTDLNFIFWHFIRSVAHILLFHNTLLTLFSSTRCFAVRKRLCTFILFYFLFLKSLSD